MAQISITTLVVLASGIVTMLDLHTTVVTQVNVVAPRLLLGEIILHTHEHIESLVRLLLAILDTLQFRFLLWCHKFNVNAVLVTFLKQKFGHGMLF